MIRMDEKIYSNQSFEDIKHIDELGNEIIPFISFVKRDKEGNSYISLLEEKEHLAKLMASGTIGDLIKNDEL